MPPTSPHRSGRRCSAGSSASRGRGIPSSAACVRPAATCTPTCSASTARSRSTSTSASTTWRPPPARLVAIGATQVSDFDIWRVMRSPGGLAFCLVPGGGESVPAPSVWPDGHRSRLVQLCVDSPADLHDGGGRVLARRDRLAVRDLRAPRVRRQAVPAVTGAGAAAVPASRRRRRRHGDPRPRRSRDRRHPGRGRPRRAARRAAQPLLRRGLGAARRPERHAVLRHPQSRRTDSLVSDTTCSVSTRPPLLHGTRGVRHRGQCRRRPALARRPPQSSASSSRAGSCRGPCGRRAGPRPRADRLWRRRRRRTAC